MCQEELQNSRVRWAAAGSGSQSKGKLGLGWHKLLKQCADTSAQLKIQE